MENTENSNNENVVTKIIKGIKNAVTFCRENKDKKCKMRTVTGTDDFYISYILNQSNND